MMQNEQADHRLITSTETISGEVFAAISAALYEVMENVHDTESNILTINRSTNTYSPWNSKIYGLRESLKK